MKFSLVLVSLLGSLALCHAEAVRLQINGPDGKPVAGAKVRFVEMTTEPGLPYSIPLKPVDLTSDAAGVVTFESKKPLRDAKGDTGGSQLQAGIRFPGFASEQLELKAGNNTLKLKKGQVFEGVALDSEQKPVAGVRLRLTNTLSPFLNSGDMPIATTDANGKYRFADLSNTGIIVVEVSDRRYKRETFQLDLAQKAPPLFLEKGATVKGRLLKPDGTAAPGVRIYAGDFQNQPVTDAQGRFEATSIGEDSIYLQQFGREEKLPFIIKPKIVNGLKPGEVRDIGDWKAISGARARGKVVDATTQKPIAKASISLWGPGDGSGQSNAQGTFDFLMEPGSTMMTASAQGYVALVKQGVPDAHNGIVDVGTVALKPGKKVTGVLVDDKGNLLTEVRVRAQKKNSNTGDAWPDFPYGVNGKFSFSGLGEGEYTIRIDGVKILSGAKFTIGKGASPAPLRVVVAARPALKNTNVKEAASITGRIEGTDGAAIAGAKIELRLTLSGGSYTSFSALSQLNGNFSVPIEKETLGRTGANAQIKVLSVTRPGFTSTNASVSGEPGNWKVKIKMQPQGLALKGRIVDAKGQSVAGAFVALRDSTVPAVASDADGNFAIIDAPQDDVVLLASNGLSLASFEVKAGQKVEIALPASSPTGDKAALLETLLNNASMVLRWDEDWEALGPQRIEAILTQKKTGDDNYMKDWVWGNYLVELSYRDPKAFLEREAELREKTADSNAQLFERVSMRCRASVGTEEQKAQIRTWLKAQEQEKREFSVETVVKLLNIAAVAERLDSKEGTLWIEYAGQIADQLADNGGQNAGEWGRFLARIRKTAPLTFGEGWKPTAQLTLLEGAMEVYGATNDQENAQKAYQLSLQLAEQAAQNPKNDVPTREYVPRASDLMRMIKGSYANLLSRTNPGEALKIVLSMEDGEQPRPLVTIAGNAAKLKQFEVAKKAIEATFQVRLGNVEFVAEATEIAQEFDPAFAATLWPRAYAKARPKPEDEGRFGFLSFGPYAGARAKWWPGESRVLIEREWQKRLEQGAKTNGDDDDDHDHFSNGDYRMSDLVVAMAKIYPERALEWLPRITEKDGLRGQTQNRVMRVLLEK